MYASLEIYITQEDKIKVTVVQSSWKQVKPFNKVNLRLALKKCDD